MAPGPGNAKAGAVEPLERCPISPTRRKHLVVATGLLRLAGDNVFRPRAPGDGRRRKDREVGVAAGQPIEADLAIADGLKLAAQQIGRRTMLSRRREGVDNTDPRAGLERGDEIVEQGVRLRDL